VRLALNVRADGSALPKYTSKYTIKHYDNTIHVFELFYPLSNQIDTIDEELIGKFTRYLSKKGLAGKTLSTYVGSLRTILYHFMKKEYIQSFHRECRPNRVNGII